MFYKGLEFLKSRLLPLLLLSLCISFNVLAQTGDVRGFVYDKDNGEPIIFTNVYLEGTTYGSSTDINGFYSINKIPTGEYTIVCTYLGYDTTKVDVSVGPGSVIDQKLYLSPAAIQIETVEISAEKQEAKTEVKTSVITVSPKQINKIPAVGGEPDLAQYLQVLPGVVFTGDQGGQLYVRGGSPIQTKVLLDGITVYNPFHSIGLFSVFETDLIKNVDVFTGGFNGKYGGRISAIVDVRYKDGNKKEMDGKISVNPLMAKAVLEGPIIPLNENGTSLSYVLSYKNSFLNLSSKTFYPYVNNNAKDENGDPVGLPYQFQDVYGKIALNSSAGSKFNLFAYNFTDLTDFQNVAEYDWRASGIGGNFVVVPGRSRFLIDGKLAYSRYNIGLDGGSSNKQNSEVGGFNLIVDFNYFLAKGKIVYGIDLAGFRTEFVEEGKVDETQNTTEMAGYIVWKGELGKLLVEPSLRIVNYASLSNIQLEPRFGLKYNATDKLRFKLALGRYTQNLLSTKSDREIVGLFTGFLTAPETDLFDNDGNRVDANIQIANHAIFGVEVDLTKRLNLNVEGYYKEFEQLINLNRNRIFPTDPQWTVENGQAYGVDFLLKYDFKRLYLWGVYSLGFVERTGPDSAGGLTTYPPHYDRRHNMNFVGTYVMGKELDWEFSLRWNLGSGFPFTRTQGFFEELDFGDGLSVDYLAANGSLGTIYDADLNGGRLPFYHRLDISVKKKFALSPSMSLEVVGSVTNVYNRENIFYFDRILGNNARVNQLPIIPSLGVSLAF